MDQSITAKIKAAIDKASPCTKDNCWDFGVEYPDTDLYDDYDPSAEDDCKEDPYTPPDPEENDDDPVTPPADDDPVSDSDTTDTENNDSDPGTDPDDDTPAGPLCGNGNVDANEICDGNTLPCNQLAGAPKNGTAKCASNCMSWDKSGCYNDGEEPPADDTEEPSADNNSSDSQNSEDKESSGCSFVLID